MPDDKSLVEEAFDLLAEALSDEAEDQRGEAIKQVQESAYDAAKQAVDRAEALDTLCEELADLRGRALKLLGATPRPPDRRRLRKGLMTPHDQYRRPILSTLESMGGSGQTSKVLEKVFALMEGTLNEHDLAILGSGNAPRWRTTACWSRNTMREEGLIVDDSPRGIWEISDAGRAWLAATPDPVSR